MCCDDPTTDPVLRAINKYKNQHGICNKKMNAGNSIMDNKNPTGIKEHKTNKQSESTTYKENNVKPNNNSNKKKIFILGDSMVEYVNGWSVSESLRKKHNVYIRSFSGSKVRCMKDYVKLCICVNDPDHIILHVGLNDLNFEKSAQLCSKSIVDLAKRLMYVERKVTISRIISRNDELNNKAAEVNEYLRNVCKQSEKPCIDHGKRIYPRKHLSSSKLHLNEKGSFILGKIFLDHLKFFFIEIITIIV